MRAVPVSLLLFWLSLSAAQVPPPHSKAPKPFSIAVDQVLSAAPDLANTALPLNHAPEGNDLLLLEVTEHSDVPHEFKETAKSYGVTITNLTNNAVTIERGILIERKTPKGWKPVAGVQAVATCTDYDQGYNSKAPTRLTAHGSLAVYPWTGFLCGGQCEDACLQNAYTGPGEFRFVVVLLPDGTRIASLPFAIPGS